MDLKTLLVGAPSPAPVTRRGLSRSENSAKKTRSYTRQELFKNEGKKAADRKTRALDLAKMRRNKRDMFANRGRAIENVDLSGGESDHDEQQNQQPWRIKERSADERKKRLEEFRKQKQMKKQTEAKTKKPPFKAGFVHYPLSEFSTEMNPAWTFKMTKNATGTRGPQGRNEVFRFGKTNSTATTNSTMTRSNSKRAPLATKPLNVNKPPVQVPSSTKRETRSSAMKKATAEPVSSVKKPVVKQNSTKPSSQVKTPAPTSSTKEMAKSSSRPKPTFSGKPQKSDKKQNKKTVDIPTDTKIEDLSKEELDEIHDAVPEMVATPKRNMAGTPLKSPLIEGVGAAKHSPIGRVNNIIFERGTTSDKKRMTKGRTLGKTPAELLGLDDPSGSSKKDPTGGDMDVDEEPVKDVKYFRQLLADTTKKLTDLCTKWEAKLTTVPKNLSNYDDVEGNIRTVIGQAHLIMDRKGRFPQFEGLINNCEFGLGEKETTCMDLQGFWEMIFYQVEDVEVKFCDLENLEARKWQSEVVVKKAKKVTTTTKATAKPVPAVAKAKASSNLRAMMAAKRKAMAEAKKQSEGIPEIKVVNHDKEMSEAKEKKPEEKEEQIDFDGGFFSVNTPAKSPAEIAEKLASAERRRTLNPTSPSKSADGVRGRKSDGSALRKSLLTKRVSASAGMTPFMVMSATASAKRSLSREASPVVRGQLDYDLDDEDNKENEDQVKNVQAEITAAFGPTRRSMAVPKENLMAFDSPMSEIVEEDRKGDKTPEKLRPPRPDLGFLTPMPGGATDVTDVKSGKKTPRKRDPSYNVKLTPALREEFRSHSPRRSTRKSAAFNLNFKE